MHTKRAILQIDEALCNGCGRCILDCAEGALRIVDGKAKIVSDSYCDGLGACIGGCPTGALRIIEREAAPFDEEAAMAHVAREREKTAQQQPCGCAGHEEGGHSHKDHHHKAHGHGQRGHAPCGGGVQQGGHAGAAFAGTAGASGPQGGALAARRHGGCPGLRMQGAPWPVKLRLIPPDAPFLKGADLVIAADCAAPVVKDFYERYAQNAVVLIGCPKFEDTAAMRDKLEALFRTAQPRSCTVLRMEVPCCAGLVRAAREAHEAAGGGFFWREMVLTRSGAVADAPGGRCAAPDPAGG